jgi:hypothetical protein
MRTDAKWGNNGAFVVPGPERHRLFVIASDEDGWEHVSISLHNEARLPTWTEMCYVKDLFWDEDEVVIQYHPAKADYVNFQSSTLHMWKPVGIELPRPPHTMVGPKGVEEGMGLLASMTGKKVKP